MFWVSVFLVDVLNLTTICLEMEIVGSRFHVEY